MERAERRINESDSVKVQFSVAFGSQKQNHVIRIRPALHVQQALACPLRFSEEHAAALQYYKTATK
jgi:hypothetical protein